MSSPNISDEIAKVFNDGGLNDGARKKKLKDILQKEWNSDKKKFTNMGDFVRQSFEDYMGDALDKDDNMRRSCNISGSLADLSKKIKIVNNLWVNEADDDMPDE